MEEKQEQTPFDLNLKAIEKQHNEENGIKKEIELPGLGKLVSVFAQEVADELKDKNTLFFRVDTKDIIEIGTITVETEKGFKDYTGFLSVKPNRFITLAEKYFIPVKRFKNETYNVDYTKYKSMGNEIANVVLVSENLQKSLPQISKIFTIPIPMLYKGELTFPKKGYDSRFCSWLPYDAPEITNPKMSLEEAKELIDTIYKEFCFEDTETGQDYYTAIAGLLTPYLRGLFSNFNVRTPVFFYLANRPRAGKDHCAGITGIVYEGVNIEETPLCTGEKYGGSGSEEFRKKLLSAFISGKHKMHFANNKGYIENAVFEKIITSTVHTDRLLGKNEDLVFNNEIDFSLSGNTGVTYSDDFADRCRFVKLFLELENANERTFDNPHLHDYVLENRGKILSALYSLVRNWKEKGSPKGSIPFASFPEWAEICGGIMESAGYGNPCKPNKEIDLNVGNVETNDMKKLFEACYKKYGKSTCMKDGILAVIKEEELFEDLDLTKKYDREGNEINVMNKPGDLIKLGIRLKKYNNRIFSDIKMTIKDAKQKFSRSEFNFSKDEKARTVFSYNAIVKKEEVSQGVVLNE